MKLQVQISGKITVFLFSGLIAFFSSCKKDEKSYSCNNGTCQELSSDAGEYASKSECEVACGNNNVGDGEGTDDLQGWTMTPIPTPPSHSESYDPNVSCQSWQVDGLPLRFSLCSYSSGGSGFYVYENTGQQNVKICWEIFYHNTSPTTGCRSNLPAGELGTGSCFDCGTSNGGAERIELTEYEVL